MSSEASEMRYCPICEKQVDGEMCPTDDVPTVPASLMTEGEPPLPNGTVINGRFRVEKLLGRGGMGCVFLATQLGMERQVAIKTLTREMSHSSDAVKRF